MKKPFPPKTPILGGRRRRRRRRRQNFQPHPTPHPITPRDSISRSGTPHSDIRRPCEAVERVGEPQTNQLHRSSYVTPSTPSLHLCHFIKSINSITPPLSLHLCHSSYVTPPRHQNIKISFAREALHSHRSAPPVLTSSSKNEHFL